MNTKKTLDLTTDNIPKCLIHLAFPILVASLLKTTFRFVNVIWVGSLGPQALAAVSSSSFMLCLFTGLNSVITGGATPLVAQSIGGKKEEDTVSVSQSAFLSALILSLFIAGSIILFSKPILRLMGLEEDVVVLGSRYINCIAYFVPFVSLSEVFAAVLIGHGNTKTPTIVFGIGIAINMVLDPLLIYGIGFPKMGLLGASWATNIAFLLEFLIFLFLAGKPSIGIKFIRDFRFDFSVIKNILRIGVPASVSFNLFYLCSIVLIKIIAHFGTGAVAAFGIGSRVEMLSTIIFYAFHVAIITMVGQNIGAQKIKRVEETVLTAVKIVFFTGTLLTIFFLLMSKPLAMLFSKDLQVISMTMAYINILAFAQVFMGTTLVMEGGFAGVGNTVPTMITSFLFTIGRLPMAYLFGIKLGWGITGVWWALISMSMAEAIVLNCWFLRGSWKKMRVIKNVENKGNTEEE